MSLVCFQAFTQDPSEPSLLRYVRMNGKACTLDARVQKGVYELLLAAILLNKAHKGVQGFSLQGQSSVEEGCLDLPFYTPHAFQDIISLQEAQGTSTTCCGAASTRDKLDSDPQRIHYKIPWECVCRTWSVRCQPSLPISAWACPAG